MSWLSNPAIKDRRGPRLSAPAIRDRRGPRLRGPAIGGLGLLEPGCDGGLLHLLDGDAMTGGGSAAILKLRRCVEGFAGERPDLDANVAVRRCDSAMGTVEAGTAILADAYAESGGLAEQQLLQRRTGGRVAQNRQQRARAALLHDDRGQHDVERAIGQGGFGNVSQNLRREIVESGFQHGYDLRPEMGWGGVRGGGGCVADAQAQHVGKTLGGPRAGAVANVLHTHEIG